MLNNPQVAERMLDATEAAILNHLENPTTTATYTTTRDRLFPYYWFAVGNYMVFYVVFDEIIEVRRFIYGSRDLTRMLP